MEYGPRGLVLCPSLGRPGPVGLCSVNNWLIRSMELCSITSLGRPGPVGLSSVNNLVDPSLRAFIGIDAHGYQLMFQTCTRRRKEWTKRETVKVNYTVSTLNYRNYNKEKIKLQLFFLQFFTSNFKIRVGLHCHCLQ